MLTFFNEEEVTNWLTLNEINWKDYRPVDLEFAGFRFREGADIFNAVQIDEPFRVTTSTGLVSGEPGDYVCKGDTSLYVWEKTLFEQDYTLL